MKRMKISLLLTCLLAGYGPLQGQNVFPTPSGNVGIGTSSPQAQLHIDGNTIMEGNVEFPGDRYLFNVQGSPADGFVRFYDAGQRGIQIGGTVPVRFTGELRFDWMHGGIRNGLDEKTLEFYTQTVENISSPIRSYRPMTFELGGNVAGDPHIYGRRDLELSFGGYPSSSGYSFKVSKMDASGSRAEYFRIAENGQFLYDVSSLIMDPNGAYGAPHYWTPQSGDALYFQSVSGLDRNVILNYQNDGRVGIGLDNPKSKLHVGGNIGVDGSIQGHDVTGGLSIYSTSYVHDGAYVHLSSKDNQHIPSRVWIVSGVTGNPSDAAVMFSKQTGLNWGENDSLMVIRNNGQVVIGDGIGIPANYQLAVEKGIITEKVKVAIEGTNNWSDFVFDKDYELMSLTAVKNYINENGHLPGVPSAEEVVEEGVDLGEMDARLLQKIEELTLYMIQLSEKVESLEAENQVLRSELDK